MRRPDSFADTTRRQFLAQTGSIAAGASLLAGNIPAVHAVFFRNSESDLAFCSRGAG